MLEDRRVGISAVQWDIQKGEVAANLETAERLLREAAQEGCNVAVLPEMWASSFLGDDWREGREATLEAEDHIRRLSRELGILIASSNYEFGAEDRLYNRTSIYEAGVLLGRYRKIHLFTPLGEDRWFTGGDEALVVESSLGLVAIATCYDLRFPELIRQLYYSGAELLLLPAQWPDARALHWRLLLRARAIENQWFIAATNRCGVEASLVSGNDVKFPGNSMIVDPTGEILMEGNGEEGAFTAEIDLREAEIVRRAIPVSKDRRDDVYEAFRPPARDADKS